MKKLSGWTLALLMIVLIAAALGLSWLLSKAAWIHQISDGIWMASYLAIMPYWIVVIVSSHKQKKGWTPGKGFRIFFGIYAAFTLLVYILQLARLF